MSTQITEEQALSKMASYCATAEHCRAEVQEKLQRWGIDYAAIARILDRLERENYIDEERYCRAFVHDKYRFDKWGKVKIAQALYLKRIPSHVSWQYLNEIDHDEYLAVLRSVLDAKRKSIHVMDDYELRRKLLRFALSRGFEMSDIRSCMEVPDEEI